LPLQAPPDETEEGVMSRLVDFYRGEAADAGGRLLKDLWGWGDDEWEEAHDFIQWLFPLPEPSRFNADAPLLTPQDIAAFRGDEYLRANLRMSFGRLLAFLGLCPAGGSQVGLGPNFAARVPEVWEVPNHNWLRISRALRSLMLLGLRAEAQALYARLGALYHSGKYPIPADTFRFWTAAVEGAP
jgi:hypothetical protein